MSSSRNDVFGLQRELTRLRGELAGRQAELVDERRRRELLYDISRTLDLGRLLSLLDAEIKRLGVFDGYLINFANAAGDGLSCARAHMPDSHKAMEEVYTHFRFELHDDDPMVGVYRTGRSVYVDADTIDRYPGSTHRGFERWAATSMVIMPIPSADGVIGTVAGFRQQGLVDSAAIEFFEEYLLLFSEPFRSALSLGELKQREQQVQAGLDEHRRFLQFVAEVNKLASPELTYAAILDGFLRAFQFDIGFLSLAESGGLATKHVSALDPAYAPRRDQLRDLIAEPLSLERGTGASAIAFLQNSPITMADAAAVHGLPMTEMDQRALEILHNAGTVLHMPIRQQGKAIGMLGLFRLGRVQPLSAGELKIIELLASFVGTAIVNAQLYHLIGAQKGQIEALNQELRGKIQLLDERVHRDHLTGLYNFGAFRTELGRRTSEVKRQALKEDLSLVVIDVDHFKRFNDTHGHLAGNLVLQELARRIDRAARAMDIPCRFGGEEFVVILPRCELAGAANFAERLRVSIESEPFAANGESLHVTVSIGCASFAGAESMEAFLERADAALFRAKAQGRNRVELA